MRTLVVLGTRGGAGVTTLVALAFTGLRWAPAGAPNVVGPQQSGLRSRAHGAQAPALAGVALWDGGVLRPDAPFARLSAPDVALALVAPGTPAGTQDARACIEQITAVDDALAARSCVILTGVHGRRIEKLTIGRGTVLTLPFDPALAEPGPLAPYEALRPVTRRAVDAWHRWAADAFALAPSAPPAPG